ncbi:MAG: hypothetical protein ACFB10_05210 [Salibacteraceae bacterium]
MRLYLLVIGLLLVVGSAEAQRRNKGYTRQNKQLFPSPPQFKKSGWYWAPGLTYMATDFRPKNKTLSDDGTNRLDGEFRARGRFPGLYLEAGRYHILQYSSLVKYIDYGIAYKGYSGREKFTLQNIQNADNTVISSTEGINKYYDHLGAVHFNLNHVWQLSDYNFIQNSLGVDGNYFFSTSRKSESSSLVAETFPGSIVASLHYKLGYGFKVSQKLMVIPTLETPILTAYNFDNGRSSMTYFNSRYRPVILSIRFLHLRPHKLKNCVPVKNPQVPGGQTVPTDMDGVR